MSHADSTMKRSELKTAWLKANDIQNPFNYTVDEVRVIGSSAEIQINGYNIVG